MLLGIQQLIMCDWLMRYYFVGWCGALESVVTPHTPENF